MARYHIPDPSNANDEQLEKWGTDPDCIEKDACAVFLAERRARQDRNASALIAARAAKREELQANPFDPRTEISADARHIAGRIVKHLWILFVLLPFIISVLLILLGVIK